MRRETVQAMVMASGFGVLSETAAYALGLWLYRSVAYTAFNIVVMFGLLMGLLAISIPRRGAPLCCALAGAAGFFYELVNFSFLDWWSFPGGKFLIFQGELQISLALALLWGAVPLAVFGLRQSLR